MIAPGQRRFWAHLQYVVDYTMQCDVRVCPDVVEQCEDTHVDISLHRKLTKKEVKGSSGRCFTQLQETLLSKTKQISLLILNQIFLYIYVNPPLQMICMFS